MNEETQTIEIPHASMRELRQRGELPSTKEGLAIELALRVGDLVAASGAGANDTVVMMQRICQTYGLGRAQLDVNSNVIIASYYPGEGMPPITSIRNVSPTVPNLAQVSAVSHLVEQICGGLSIGRATKRFDRIVKADPPYPGWLAGLAAGGISMSVQLLYTTSPKVLILALITGYLVNRFVYLLDRRGLPVLFQQIFGGWLVVLFAAGCTWLNAHPRFDIVGYLSPATIAVGCIFQLVVGQRFVAGIQDAIDGFYVTASARIFQVVMMTSGLVIGLVTGLGLARRLGIDVYISSSAPVKGSVILQFVAAIVTAILWAISNFANATTIAVTAGVTALSWTAFWVVLHLGLSSVVGSFVGPMIGALAVTILVRRWWQIPAFGVINGMGIPFVPGLSLYLGLIQMVGSNATGADPSRGGATLGTAAAIALAIAGGASLGVFLGRPFSEKLTVISRPSRHPRPALTPAGGRLRHVPDAGNSTPAAEVPDTEV